jgi:hypothetical protein
MFSPVTPLAPNLLNNHPPTMASAPRAFTTSSAGWCFSNSANHALKSLTVKTQYRLGDLSGRDRGGGQLFSRPRCSAL